MTAVAVQPGAGSPRTAQYPKAFTLAEFTRGALIAFAIFQLMGLIISFTVFAAGSWPQVGWGGLLFGRIAIAAGGIVGFPASFVALFLGSPAAYLLGHLLRRVQPDWIHLTAFAVYGLLVGAATTTDVAFLMGADTSPNTPTLGDLLWLTSFVIASGAAVMCGRRSVLVAARKADAASPL